jgi:hypothetical protein
MATETELRPQFTPLIDACNDEPDQYNRLEILVRIDELYIAIARSRGLTDEEIRQIEEEAEETLRQMLALNSPD